MKFTRLLASIAMALSAAAGAHAQDAPFYAGKTVAIQVGTSPGGYYDIAGRTVARNFGRFIPGSPAMVVQNVPGAGGLALGNRLANTVARDGLTIVAMNRALAQLALVGDPNAQFDPLALTWLGSLSSYEEDAYLMVVRDEHPARKMEDINKQAKPIKLGGTRAGATNIVFALMAHDLLKLKVDLVRGYPGASQIWLAMESGELDGQFVDISAILVGRPNLWKEGKLHPLVAFGRTKRLPGYPDVPIARELVKEKHDLALLEFAELPFFMALPFAAPPQLPPDREKTLTDSFMKMAWDKDFRAEMLKVGIMTSPIDGTAVRALINRAAKTPTDIRERFAKILAN
ncbi:MAG: Bug family tripartite tricarboxylate transporter substrate binding protein [Beijerinckiaceae bacterium]